MKYIPGDFRPGCVVAVNVTTSVGVVSHKGILSDQRDEDGLPKVIHAAKFYGAIVESSMRDYMLKSVGPLVSEGYPSAMPPGLVIARARALLGQPWRPWANCEHFAYYAHGLAAKSPQMRAAGKKALAMGGIGAFVWFAFTHG